MSDGLLACSSGRFRGVRRRLMSTLAAFGDRSGREQLAHSYQVQGSEGDVGELLEFPSSHQPGSSQAPDLLQPSEDLFGELSLALAQLERPLAHPLLIEPPRPRPVIILARNIQFLRALARRVRF